MAIHKDDVRGIAQAVKVYGVDLNKTMKNGRTLLHEACIHEATAVTEWLIANGAEIDDVDDISLLLDSIERLDREKQKKKKAEEKQKKKKKKAGPALNVHVLGKSTMKKTDMALFGRLHTFLEGKASTAHQLFKEFDKDSSGALDDEEFVKVDLILNLPLSLSHI